MKFILTLSILILSFSAGFCGTLEKLSSNSGKPERVVIFIEQQKTISLLDETVNTTAVICADSRGRIRWQTFSPYESIMIFDGDTVAQYERVASGWQKLQTQSGEKIKKLIMGISKMVSGDYSEFSVFENGTEISLVPKDALAEKFMKKISIVPNSDCTAVERIEITDSEGDKTVLRIKKLVKNPSDFESAFTHTFNYVAPEK